MSAVRNLLASLPERLCSNCERGYMGGSGVFCTEFMHLVEDERAAIECTAFDNVADHVAVTVNGKVVEPATGAISEDLVAACDRYLADRHITLWGEPFEIISSVGRRKAAEWLAEQVHGLRTAGVVP